jgi:hypothetical protein
MGILAVAEMLGSVTVENDEATFKKRGSNPSAT